MKILKLFLLILILSNFSELRSDEKIRNDILKNVRCLICQGQSVYDSDSEFASTIKFIVEKNIAEGLSEEQIYEFLKGKYGQWILYEPEMSKNTYILWLLPMLLFLFGGAIIYKILIIKKNKRYEKL